MEIMKRGLEVEVREKKHLPQDLRRMCQAARFRGWITCGAGQPAIGAAYSQSWMRWK